MENQKYEGLDKSFYEEEKTLIEKISGAKKVIAGVALAASLASISIGLDLSCHRNDPTMFACPITQLETRIFGYEAGLRHQAHDLEGYSRELKNLDDGILHEISATGVEYVEEHTEYYAPNGGILTQDEAGEMIVEQTVPATTIINEEGKAFYTVPSGYVLKGTMGVKETKPLSVTYPTSVNFEFNFLEDGEITNTYDESWTYQDGEFVLDRELKGKTR